MIVVVLGALLGGGSDVALTGTPRPPEPAPRISGVMESPDSTPQPDRRVLFWIGFGVGVAALGAALAYVSLRLATARREDPTTQRIQQLIDEANSLLKALDDQRNSA